MQLQTINWPVFRLTNGIPKYTHGIYYYEDEVIDTDTGIFYSNIKVIDDINIPGDNLGIRRAKLIDSGYKQELWKLSKAIYFPADLVKLTTSKYNTYIDYTGKVFTYTKSVRAKLKCHRIKKVIHVRNGAILELYDTSARYKSILRPEVDQYAGILHFNRCTLLYGIYNSAFSTTFRKV